MTISMWELALYSGALVVLFMTPGPVWVALVARSLSGGFNAAWPLALGVVVGDIIWPLVAIFGVSWVASEFAGFMDVLKWVAVAVFVTMGLMLLRSKGGGVSEDSRLTRPGMWAGLLAGVAVILGNPKAVLFYMGVLPGFFDVSRVTWVDIVLIVAASIVVPLVGNLVLAAFIDRARRVLSSPKALRRVNVVSGSLLLLVGLVIALI